MDDRRRALTRAARDGLFAGLAGLAAVACAPAQSAVVSAPMETAAPLPAPSTPHAAPSGGPVQGLATPSPKDCCAGKNACKGQGGCAGKLHDCKGKNDCKGTGTSCDSSDED